jgi:hypothetical protein
MYKVFQHLAFVPMQAYAWSFSTAACCIKNLELFIPKRTKFVYKLEEQDCTNSGGARLIQKIFATAMCVASKNSCQRTLVCDSVVDPDP